MAGALGSDVALTRYAGTAGSAPLDFAHSWGTLDLAVAPRVVGLRATGPAGLATVSDRANLAQALILRLLTPVGSLAALGHTGYGSRLGELIGRRNDAATRALARLFVIEALAGEPRAQLRGLTVDTDPASPDTVLISFEVLPTGDPEPLGLTLGLGL